MTLSEQEPLIKLRKNKDILIISADKANTTVVVKKADHDKEVQDIPTIAPIK